MTDVVCASAVVFVFYLYSCCALTGVWELILGTMSHLLIPFLTLLPSLLQPCGYVVSDFVVGLFVDSLLLGLFLLQPRLCWLAFVFVC